MLQPHLKIDKITKYVFLPGDSGRIDKVLKYLIDVKEININREYRSCVGKYNGIEIAMVSSGIGCPAAAIAVEELANIGAKFLIRIGTCGGLLKEMKPGDIVIPSSTICSDGTTKEYEADIKEVEANKEIKESLVRATENLKINYFTGINRTHDAFYESTENFIKLTGKGLISSEMECSAVFLVSKLRGLKAGAILVVNTPEPPEEVFKNPDIIYKLVDENKVCQGIDVAIKIALEAVSILDEK